MARRIKIKIQTEKKYECPKCHNLVSAAGVAAGRGHDCLRCCGARYEHFRPVTSIVRTTLVDGYYQDVKFSVAAR
jgi:transcription elongation factor Elf1